MPRKKKTVLNQENATTAAEVIVTKPEIKEEVEENMSVTDDGTPIHPESFETKPEIEKALESINIVPVELVEKLEEAVETETPEPELVVKEVKPQSVADRRRALRYGMKPK